MSETRTMADALARLVADITQATQAIGTAIRRDAQSGARPNGPVNLCSSPHLAGSQGNPHLRALIVAALETGCRVGELLSLQWHQVRFDLNEVHLPAKKTKALRRRDLPISQRLRALLEMRRTDPAGEPYKPSDYVFGDVAGQRVKSVKTAWENAVLKAHGVEVKRGRQAGYRQRAERRSPRSI